MWLTRAEFCAKRATRTVLTAACPSGVCPRTATAKAVKDSAIAARCLLIVCVSPSEISRKHAEAPFSGGDHQWVGEVLVSDRKRSRSPGLATLVALCAVDLMGA